MDNHLDNHFWNFCVRVCMIFLFGRSRSRSCSLEKFNSCVKRSYIFFYDLEMDNHLDNHFCIFGHRVCMDPSIHRITITIMNTWEIQSICETFIYCSTREKWITTWMTTFAFLCSGLHWSSYLDDHGADHDRQTLTYIPLRERNG